MPKKKVIVREITETCYVSVKGDKGDPGKDGKDGTDTLSEYKVHRTAFVNSKYFSTTPELENPTKPFQTIQAALDSVPLTERWLVKVRPGEYSPFTLTNNVDVEGESSFVLLLDLF